MLSYLRYNRISNGDYSKCMCLYSNECEIPELSNILDFTVVFTPPPFSPEIVPAVFHVCPFRGILFGLRATPKSKEVKSFIIHSIARLHTPPACIRYRLYIFLANRGLLSHAHSCTGRRLFISYIRCFPPQWKCNLPRKTATNTAFRRREQHKALSDSLAFENAPIQRLLNGQIVAP